MNSRRLVTRTRTCCGLLCAAALIFLLAGSASAAPGDLTLKRKPEAASGFPVSIFPHWVHRIHYRCDACHTRLFQMQAGATEISMADINAGRACGSCHNGKRSFAAGFDSCNRCHVPVTPE